MSTPPVFEHFADLMQLEPHGPDVYVGLSPEYPWGRVYGGQVVAQGLAAAALTVEDTYRPHSMHAYFIRGGTSAEPIRFEVDRIRNGRSFATRRVVARQSNGAILNLSASFHIDEGDVDVQVHNLDPNTPMPEDLESETWTPLLDRRHVTRENFSGPVGMWLKVNGPLPEWSFADAVALAYASDETPYDGASNSHPGINSDEDRWKFMGASLDHAIWFHRPAPSDDWLLFESVGEGMVGSRGLASGRVFTRDGLHVATVSQEILLRPDRNAVKPSE